MQKIFKNFQKKMRGRISLLWVLVPVIAVVLVQWLIGSGDRAHAAQTTEKGMSLFELLSHGGIVMVFIGVLSIAVFALAIYFFMTLKLELLVPTAFKNDILEKLRLRKYAVVRELCERNDNVVSRMILSGLDRIDRGPETAREAVELSAKNELLRYWERLSYLADLSAVGPLVGLFGTVLGMIQAFNTIASQSTILKPMLLAGGVAKAFVNTAGGLGVAIPAMLFYAYFRTRLSNIAGRVETVSADVVDSLSVAERKK